MFQSCFESPEFAKKIVIFLNEKRSEFTRSEIVDSLKVGDGGNLTKVLNSLISSNFVEKYIPFGKNSKISYYKLVDPFCIFYLKFIYNKKFKENFWQENNDTQVINIERGIAFENVCFNHIKQIKQSLNILGVSSINSSWNYNFEEQHGQIDLIISW